jgi:hypothetical protein
MNYRDEIMTYEIRKTKCNFCEKEYPYRVDDNGIVEIDHDSNGDWRRVSVG